ncbi:helix-turn-helix domain-containing protein [Pseudobacillus badius]|uniref:helix-turn-helix domain-containing protein n=1 Tax=Bacillus badius TaxID=1455 RepID=UPI0007B3D47D|nr:helix-turn-helix domain-containing protein [Bacillus badius]KZR56953.1 transcriptional regulator [Bacillus badius]
MQELRQYETFESVSEMDEYISKVFTHFELKKIERELLWLLAGHSVKFIGVSFLKLDTMAEALKVSKRTIQRALKALGELGIINRVRTIRPKRGGFGSSITQICPVELSIREEAPEPAPEGIKEPSQGKETFSFKAFSKDIKYIRQEVEIDYSYLEAFGIPTQFIDTVKPFVTPEEAFSLWGKVNAVADRHAPAVINIIKPAIEAFKASVLAYKQKRVRKSFGAYFWGALVGVFAVEQRRAHTPKFFYNWLEER